MEQTIEVFNELKQFVGFDDEVDGQRLERLAPVFAEHGPTLTDAFYQRLQAHPGTAGQIAGRVDTLKQTHARWMAELFAGAYQVDYFHRRHRIGLVHVRVGVLPRWCAGIISFLRTCSLPIVLNSFSDRSEGAAHYGSLVKILDLDLMVINLAYEEERLRRLATFTGMSRKLIERCITKG